MKKKQNRANKNLSGKTYLEMGDETKLQIEALYYCYNLNSHQIGDIVNWPWQSCSKHIKVMNDRIEYGKTTFEKLEAQGNETIAKYSLDLYVNGIPETDDPSLKEEIAVVDPKALAQAFPEIIKPKIEETATDSEISVPPVEDAPKAEEKASEAETPEQWGKRFESSAIREDLDVTDEESGQELSSIAKCRICGCDDLHACDGGCYWVEDDLCSKCAQNLNEEHNRRVRKDVPFYLTIQNLLDRYEAGEITFNGMILDESQGIFRIEYASA